MLNRLKKILEFYNLSASAFADSIDVPRSSISHLLSGRNKPSLDFVMKVVDKFKEVDLYWFLYGEGSFPKKEEEQNIKSNNDSLDKENTEDISDLNLFSENETSEVKTDIETIPTPIKNNKYLVKVILLYNDGSFEEYNK